MTPRWLYNRLRTMGTREIGHRIAEGFRERLQSIGVGNARPVPPGLSETKPWVTPLPSCFATDEYRRAADSVLEGSFRVFALSPCRLGFPPDWNRDPRTGTRAPLVFGKTINYRCESRVGNVKYLWEPNRHLELVTLAQAWHLTRHRAYAVGCRSLVDSWIEQCPYPFGANWSSALELGIRLVNWSFAWHLLGGEASPILAGDEGARFRQRWLTSIYQHCHFIARYPSLHSSANNHLLGEKLGLLVGSLTWPNWPESLNWSSEAHESFEREALLQNSADGVNREQGIWYHHEVVDMMIIAGLVARASGVEFSPAYWSRIELMLEFTASVMDCGGNVPAFGDSDDGVIVRFCPQDDFAVFQSQLATGAVLFNRSEFKAKAREFDDKSRWLLGDAAASHFSHQPADNFGELPRRAFPEGGYYILGNNFDTPKELKAIVDAGPLGYLSIAAHGHADALSFTLSVGGKEILIDPGTYSYHTDPRWRGYFRGTAAHNTIRVDGMDQSVSGGNFMWTQHARAHCEQFEVTKDHQLLRVSHDGYRRLSDPVVHSREFAFIGAESVFRVIDRLNASGHHRFELFMHFSDTCDVAMRGDHAIVSAGESRVSFTWPTRTQARLVRGQESPPLGWFSRHFDVKQPCSTILVSGEAKGNWCGTSEFRLLSPTGSFRGR